jgi:rare lipoprotein A
MRLVSTRLPDPEPRTAPPRRTNRRAAQSRRRAILGTALLLVTVVAAIASAAIPAGAAGSRASQNSASAATRARPEQRVPGWWRTATARRGNQPARSRPVKVIHTRASWYGPGFHGRRTASGERFNQNAMTLASRHLPFGTRVRVVNLKTGKAAIGRVNDRGPFRGGYQADLSKALAKRIGMGGVAPVRIEVLPHPQQ